MANKTNQEDGMSKVKAYRKIIDSRFPGPRIKYFYITEIDSRPWVADIEDEAAEGWGDDFEWDDDPCGHGIKAEEVENYLKDADEIGYIEDNKLHITKRWKVPTAYGYKPDMTPVITSWEWSDKL